MTVRAVIQGCGHYLPKRVVDNSEFERTLDTSDDWISSRSGIKRRHFANKDETTSVMATLAAKEALADANLRADDIDAIILATSTSDLTFPLVALIAFLLPVFAAIRLSNFNLDKNQKDSFIGLPTPMVAIFIASLPFNNLIDLNLMSLCIITILLSLLLVSKIN